MRRTIYITGKIEDIPKQERLEKFNKMQKAIELKGYKAINPVLLTADIINRRFAIKIRLLALENSDAIFMLPCSVGCSDAEKELQKAIDMGIDIYSDINDIQQCNS